jgi:hypothetical protein
MASRLGALERITRATAPDGSPLPRFAPEFFLCPASTAVLTAAAKDQVDARVA